MTLRGEPVAVIRPLTEKSRRELLQAEVDEDLAEVAAALGRGLGDAELADYAVGILRSRRWVDLFPVTQALATRAAKIAAEHKIRGCDAIYVALAQQLGMELVTLDGDQLDRGAAVIKTRTP